MLSSISNSILETATEMSQNPVSLFIFCLISILIVALIMATTFDSWRRALIGINVLEEDEKPSSLLTWILGIIILVKIIQAFLIQPFVVDGASMVPTYHNQDFLLLDKLSYNLHAPHRGDVAIFKLYEGGPNPYAGKFLIKRVIGLPNERIVVTNGVTTIYNAANPKGFVVDEPYVTFKDLQKNVDVTLDDHHYFMMGDNRAQSYDSREWGPLDVSNIRGQVLFRIYPLSSISYEPGQFLYSK